MSEAAPESPVDALIKRYSRGRSIREIERENGLREGSLSHYVKPSQRGRWPSLSVLERFARALGASLTEVSKAFAAESGVELDDDLSPAERELILNFRALDAPTRALAFDFLAVAAEHARRTAPLPDSETVATSARS